MALYADRVKDTSVSTGTGAITLANSAPTGFQTFATAFGVSDITVAYCIADQTGNNWEVGTGVFNGTTGLTRETVLGSSNSGSLVNFTSGTKDVFCTAPAKYLEPGGGYTVNTSANVDLNAASTYNQFFIGGSSSATLPDVTTLPLGYTVHIVNQTSSTLLVDADGTTIFLIPINTGALFTCIRVTIPQDTAWVYATSDLWSTGDGSSAGNTGISGIGAAVHTSGATLSNVANLSTNGPTLLQNGSGSLSIVNGGSTASTLQIIGQTASLGRNRIFSSPALRITAGSTNPITFRTAASATDVDGDGNEQFRVANTASAVNYVQVTGGAAGTGAAVSARGSDSSLALVLQAQGASGTIGFGNTTALNNQAFRVSTGSAVNTGNLLLVTGAAAGSAPSLAAISGTSGTDANIDLALTPKGTGNVRFGTYTGTILTPTGYVEIKDSGGTVRRLLVG